MKSHVFGTRCRTVSVMLMSFRGRRRRWSSILTVLSSSLGWTPVLARHRSRPARRQTLSTLRQQLHHWRSPLYMQNRYTPLARRRSVAHCIGLRSCDSLSVITALKLARFNVRRTVHADTLTLLAKLLTFRRTLLPYGYSCKASCARPG